LYRFMIENGYAVNLTPYLDADASFDACIADVTKARWEETDGALYTVSDVLLLSGGYWYNRDLFEQANIKEVPATWDDFTDVLQALSEQAGRRRDTDCSVILDEEHILYLADAVLADQTDEDLYRLLHNDIDFRHPPFTEVLSRLKEISRYAQTREQFTYRDTLEAFNLGKTAIYINGAWANTMIRDDLDVRYAAFPSEDGTGTSCISSNLGYVLGNTRDVSRIDASVAFLKYMLSDDVQKRIVEETGQIASSPRIDRSVISGNERLSQAVDCVQSAGTVIDTPENLWKKELQTRFTAHVNTMLSSPDETTPSE
ncbi:MAG: extracellular solute-binding protein, partial [Lachnospiraceae bacterium]|nr:extracellular solute-binding protein [Lachnospiraceae bacterium]